ncbi:hypothetical protein SAMD00019534_096570 [Acytostelium subglobosum LB1]|uniref:hypothetical protein n=1 Tax=Acytostelium subglobosum LB1 TaxID=1410327 RepID=UPI0006450BD9|nr:hypothetical protein SAMD00019534_096570 [Acytostelium subglobosum LB1]GAM26482.1 hypothetical protein SAMD00019534_096570 [Acytostelium subglobosum LB1]|eukprot:XP_012750578.1 hypothetical protein SAMD00019534_096570 [Acytostelium subglobosum LB1]
MFQRKPGLRINLSSISGTNTNADTGNTYGTNSNNVASVVQVNNNPNYMNIQPEHNKPFSLTNSGTFREGDLAINKRGLLIKGESPKSTYMERRPNRYPGLSGGSRKTTSTTEDTTMDMDIDDNNSNDNNNNYNSSTSMSTSNTRSNNNSNSSSTSSSSSSSSNTNNYNYNSSSMQPNYDIQSFQLKDLKIIKVLGRGQGGVVKLAYHEPSKSYVALKVMPLDIQENVRKQIILELKTLYKTHCPHIVSFYDAFYSEGSIQIALEFMDGGSLTDLLQRVKVIPEPVLAKLTLNVLQGLFYLHKEVHLIHRDIKPSNILLNRKGEAKISDFGVSSQRQDTMSKAVTWVGTVVYMSPERISGKSYSYDSDIWSLGLTILECALGRYPYIRDDNNGTMLTVESMGLNFWTLLDFIIKEPVPFLPPDRFSVEFCSFISDCLQKEPEERPSAASLLRHPFIKKYQNDDINLMSWISSNLQS